MTRLGRGRSLIPFEKMTSREQCVRSTPVLPSDEQCFSTASRNIERLSTVRRTTAPNFDYFKARYRVGQTLPSFMENLNTRMALTGLSSEMLTANNYANASFRPVPQWMRKPKMKAAPVLVVGRRFRSTQ